MIIQHIARFDTIISTSIISNWIISTYWGAVLRNIAMHARDYKLNLNSSLFVPISNGIISTYWGAVLRNIAMHARDYKLNLNSSLFVPA